MAVGIPTTKAAFDAQKHSMAVDAVTKAYQRLDIAQANASRTAATFADATGRGRITLENFGRTFDNATRKVLIWQLAIMAVYGAIRKFSDTIQVWRDFEVTLARISITTEALGSKLQQYFMQVSDVAIRFGMPIQETLTGMDLALRATADLGTGAKRTATAVSLLESASALANITGMQYGQSIDILVGSLRQTGLSLDRGIDLLDKWTAVAKNAAVSVNDLSQGFAIMADAGRAAGLTVDQINGLIAALSETVTLGPVQVGNAIRAIMSTLYNPGSINLLQKYGVAVRNTTGEVRSFWEVMTQLSAMKTAGVLDESIWLEIAKAAGAGQRRYAQFLALLNNWDAAMRASNISMDAQGQAMDANEKIVETLTNTFDKFSAAQNKAMFVLGQQTGAIEDLTGVLQGLTNVFDSLSTAPDIVWNLGRAIMFLVGTLGALKVASLAMGWLGVGPRVGAMMGRFGGIAPAAVAHSPAAMRAIQAGGFTTPEMAAAAGISTVAPGVAARVGMLGLTGLLPGFMRAKMFGRVPELQNIMWKGGAWRTAAGRFAPVPSVSGQPFVPMTWGRVGRAMVSPVGGMGRAIGAVGAGAAAYGLTGEWQSAVGAGIGTAIGGAFGPIGMVVGAGIGTLIGHTMADAFISQEDRLRKVFQEMAEDFTLDMEAVMDRFFDEAEKTTDEARRAAALAAPKFPEARVAEAQPFWKRLLSGVQLGEARLGWTLGGEAAFAPFGRQGEDEWKKGHGALNELNQALVDGVITLEEYRAAKKDDYIAWQELSDEAKAYMTAIRGMNTALGEEKAVFEAITEAIPEQLERKRELATINNRYSESQARIRELMSETGAVIEGMSLKEWEQTKTQELLRQQINKTADDFQSWYDVLLGASYGYAAHVEAVERLRPLLEEFGLTVDRIPEDKWLLIQRWDPTLATRIVESYQTLQELNNAVDKFRVDFPEILRLAGVDATIEDIDSVREALEDLYESTGDEKYQEALERVNQYMADILQREIEARRAGTYTRVGAEFQRPTQVRLVDAETLKAYREGLGNVPRFTELAKGLGETADSVLTLVDPITGEMLRLEENTLALEMLSRVVQDNTTAQEKRLEAEYNLPSGYIKPSRYWYYKTTGSTEFGPQQQSLWAMWDDFVRKRGRASGGDIPQTGAYFLHRGEAVLNGDILSSTNNILVGSHQVLVNSQNYLSQINMGIIALREEVASLRGRLNKVSGPQRGLEFSRVAGAGQGGDIPTFGARGLLE